MKATHQAPFPEIEVYDPLTKRLIMSFGADGTNQSLLSYTFSEGVRDLEGAFTFSIADGKTRGGSPVFDTIRARDIVMIYEGGEKPVFTGVIRRKRMAASVTERGIRRSVQLSGSGIISLISRFIISMDIQIMDVANADIVSTKFTTDLAGRKLTIKSFLDLTLRKYSEISLFGNVIANTEVMKTIELFIGKQGDFFETGERDPEFKYDIARALFNQGQNSVTEIWRSILPEPVYELFSRVNAEGVPRIVAREAPFDSGDWGKLPSYELSPMELTGYDLSQNDEEVYTVFNSYLEGSPMSHEFYTIISQYTEKGDTTIKYNKEKLGIYGYRPLEVTFRGYNQKQNERDAAIQDIKTEYSKLNERIRDWYSRLDDMVSGQVTMVTSFNLDKNKEVPRPRAGERLYFLGGQFYITDSQHTWTYGGTPQTVLTVSRGMNYGIGEQRDKIKGIGKSLIELENEVNR